MTNQENIPVPSAATPSPKKIKERKVKPIRERPPLRCVRFQGRWTFLVERESSPNFGVPGDEWKEDAHTVDLEENFVTDDVHGIIPNGGCDCSDFTFKRRNLVEGGRKISRCKHIKAAMFFIVGELIAETIKRDRERAAATRLEKLFDQ